MARTRPGWLVHRRPDGSEQHVRLDEDLTTLGRSDSCSVTVPSPTVSRLHARIEIQHDRYILFDAGSANGTFVNGKRIEHGYQLTTGDEIGLGSKDAMLSFADPEETLA